MAARQSAPVIGALCSGSTSLREAPRNQPWTFTVSYRYQPSTRHFVGTSEQPQRDANNNEILNIYHLLDFSISRQITRRWSANLSLPVLFAYRDQLYVPRGEYRVNSIGDMSVGGKVWLFRPPTESGGNLGLGFNLKLPTGTYNASGLATDRNGRPITATADQSIQAGDGGTGFSLDLTGYKPLWFQSMGYFSAAYLFNPRNTNGVSTFRTGRGEEVMSVSDQYLWRAGFSRPLPRFRNITASFGARMEGVPVRDLLGKSDGFRRPGYALSLDPGFMFDYRGYLVSVNVPFAIKRDRKRNVPDYVNGRHGDAAFADYALILSFTRRF